MQSFLIKLLVGTLFYLPMTTFGVEEGLPKLVIPIRVHLMQSANIPAMQTTLNDSDVERIFGKVNMIWRVAGIVFEIESIRRTSAVENPNTDGLTTEHARIKAAIPKESLSAMALDVCYVKSVTPNGFYYGEPVVVKDTASLKEVTGGIDEPLPRVTAHEIGHALGLRHRQETFNLMASGTTGYSLNAEEIKTARAKAQERFSGDGTVR